MLEAARSTVRDVAYMCWVSLTLDPTSTSYTIR
jgi:hypothetical protein